MCVFRSFLENGSVHYSTAKRERIPNGWSSLTERSLCNFGLDLDADWENVCQLNAYTLIGNLSVTIGLKCSG